MPRALRIVISRVAPLAIGCAVWSAVARFDDPRQQLTTAEQVRLASLITQHKFVVEMHLSESGLPYHISTISPEAHTLFNHKPLATLHFLKQQVTDSDPETSVRAGAIAMAASEGLYDARSYLFFLSREYDDVDPQIGRSRRQILARMVNSRIEKIATAKTQASVDSPQRDRGTLGADRLPLEARQEDKTLVVNLVRTSEGVGYWTRR